MAIAFSQTELNFEKKVQPFLINHRRQALKNIAGTTTVLIASPWAMHNAYAGGQLEEPLVDSVRSALSAAVNSGAPPVPEFSNMESRLKYLRWLGAMSDRLKKKKPDYETRKEFLQTVWYESKRAGLDTTMVMGLITVESNFRKHAVSSVGARGYMQIMPFWTRVIGDGDASKLFHANQYPLWLRDIAPLPRA
jgi:soluble lytic murein transglycosylase-like protein